MEVGSPVDSAVGTFLLLGGTCSNLPERPPLELVLVLFGEFSGSGVIGGFANDLVGVANLRSKGERGERSGCGDAREVRRILKNPYRR